MATLKIYPQDKQQMKTVKAFLKALKIPFEISQESEGDRDNENIPNDEKEKSVH